jgi:hypothetical protein
MNLNFLRRSVAAPDIAALSQRNAILEAELRILNRGRIRRLVLFCLWTIMVATCGFFIGKFAGKFEQSTSSRARAIQPSKETLFVDGPKPPPEIIEIPQKRKKKTIIIAPRGGRYSLSENGNKVYERKSR